MTITFKKKKLITNASSLLFINISVIYKLPCMHATILLLLFFILKACLRLNMLLYVYSFKYL